MASKDFLSQLKAKAKSDEGKGFVKPKPIPVTDDEEPGAPSSIQDLMFSSFEEEKEAPIEDLVDKIKKEIDEEDGFGKPEPVEEISEIKEADVTPEEDDNKEFELSFDNLPDLGLDSSLEEEEVVEELALPEMVIEEEIVEEVDQGEIDLPDLESIEIKTPEPIIKTPQITIEEHIVRDEEPAIHSSIHTDILDYVCKQTVKGMLANYNSQMITPEFSHKLFEGYVEGTTDSSNPLFKALIAEAIESGYTDDYLGDRTESALRYIEGGS